MARLSASDILRRYAAGERDFRGAILRGLSFRGENLSEADFSGADLRSTDFSNAMLQRANFSNALGGRQRRWSVLLFFMTSLMGAVAGTLLGLVNGLLALGLTGSGASMYSAFGLTQSIAIGVLIVLSFLFLAWEGPTARGVSAVACTFAVVLASASYIAGAGAGTFALIIAVAVAVASSFAVIAAVAGTFVSANPVAVTAAYAFTLAVASSFAGHVAGSSSFSGAFPVAGASDFAGTFTFIVSLFIIPFSYWRSCQRAPGYAWSRAQGVALCAMGGTNFRGADLGGAILSGARLSGCNFASPPKRPTLLHQVCWSGARGLEWAQLGGTILADQRIRRLLVEAEGRGQDFSGINLRGAHLAGADLRFAAFKNAILSNAILSGAHLEEANLAGAKCLGTDFSEAHLTGACVEDWNIDSSTNLNHMDCGFRAPRKITNSQKSYGYKKAAQEAADQNKAISTPI